MISNISLAAGHDSKATGPQPVFVRAALKGGLMLALGAMLSATAVAATPAPEKVVAKQETTAAKPVVALPKDPLAGDTWHAMGSTWPGTIVFNSAKKTVTLAPVGADAMQATYTYTVKPTANPKVVEGTLRMTNSAKQVSNSTFRIVGKELTLTYAGGPRPEQYVRMTPKEEEAEKARLQKMISEGRIRPLK